MAHMSDAAPDVAAAAADTPPTDKKRARAERVSASAKAVRDGVIALYGATGMGITLLNEYDGTVILMRAEAMADSVIAACTPYPDAMKVLRKIALGNVWTLLVMAHLGPLVAIAANHGVISRAVPSKFGLPTPEEHSKPVHLSAEEEAASEEAFLREQVAQQYQQQAYVQQSQATQAVAQNGSTHLQAGGVGGPLGDASEVAARRAFTEEQIAKIRAEAIANALREQGASQ